MRGGLWSRIDWCLVVGVVIVLEEDEVLAECLKSGIFEKCNSVHHHGGVNCHESDRPGSICEVAAPATIPGLPPCDFNRAPTSLSCRACRKKPSQQYRNTRQTYSTQQVPAQQPQAGPLSAAMSISLHSSVVAPLATASYPVLKCLVAAS